jgi:hypothetical protein
MAFFDEDDPDTRALRMKLNQLLDMGGASIHDQFRVLSDQPIRSEASNDVKQIIKSCLQVEDDASRLKSKTFKK